DFAGAKRLAAWRRKLAEHWREVSVEDVTPPPAEPLRGGDQFDIRARVHLGALSPDDVEVQPYHGTIDSFGEIASPSATRLGPVGPPGANSSAVFGASVPCVASGQYGFSVRVLPQNTDLPDPFEPGLVTWG